MIRLKLNDKVFLMYFLQLFLYKCIERLVLIPNSVHIGIRIIAIACLQKINVKSYKLLVNLFSIKKQLHIEYLTLYSWGERGAYSSFAVY